MITVLVGPPCAGKTTAAHERAAAGDVIIDFDALAMALGSAEPFAAPEAIRKLTFSARDAAIAGVLEGITVDAWIIHTSPTAERVRSYRAAGAVLELVDPGVDECLSRAKVRPDGTTEVIEAWYRNPPKLADEEGDRAMAKQALEIRTANLGPIELRADGDGLGVLGGYAAMFNKLSQNLGGFVEQVAPGAFTKSLADKNPVLARYNHDNNFLLGTSEAETLRLSEDGTGLLYEVDMPDTSAGRDVATLARRSDIRYSSFAFHTLEDDWSLTENGFPLRTLIAVRLVDVAPVNNPAYRDTSVGMRSLADRIGLDSIVDVSTDEIRERLSSPAGAGVQHANGQGDTHPSLTLRSRKLLLLKP